jgi:DNA-binding GntR family transcriptional regulator
VKRPDFDLPRIALERTSREALHRQIARQISAAVRTGTLTIGSRLPSSRLMATLLGVSRHTILGAYDELASRGLLRGEPGSGMRIAAGTLRRMPSIDLLAAIRDAHFPARILSFGDPDGNPLYLSF